MLYLSDIREPFGTSRASFPMLIRLSSRCPGAHRAGNAPCAGRRIDRLGVGAPVLDEHFLSSPQDRSQRPRSLYDRGSAQEGTRQRRS